jgi:hypothetical protein
MAQSKILHTSHCRNLAADRIPLTGNVSSAEGWSGQRDSNTRHPAPKATKKSAT